MYSEDFANSKIPCPICNKELAKNYMTSHLKKQHTNAYKDTIGYWDKYVIKYRETLKQNRDKHRLS